MTSGLAMSLPESEPAVAVEDDAEEGEIVDDEDEEDEAEDKQQQSTTHTQTQHKTGNEKSTSSSSSSSDKHKRTGNKSGRDSSKSKSRKRHKDFDGDEADDKAGEKVKRERRNESHSDSDSSDSAVGDEEATKQRLMMRMMQIMLNASKRGRKSDKKTIEQLDKVIKRGTDVSTSELRDIVRKNRTLLRAGSRERRSRSRSRDRRTRNSDRNSRARGHRDRSGSRGKESSDNKTNRSFEGIDPRTGVGLLKEKCKFFAEGKCQKGFECPYSHEVILAKKKEICKFYLQGFCGKGEHCFFMHEDFPCKFFHTGAECYSGDKCRFSHQPLTEDGRSMLRGYLDSGELPDDHLRLAALASGDNSGNVSGNSVTTCVNSINNVPPPPVPVVAVSTLVAEVAPAPVAASTMYQPVKPVPKRHAILGDVTDAMRSSYYTWTWQQEMRELEMAYTGSKRNLFTIEKQFAMTDKPDTPPPEDPDEEECKVFSYYIDTMGDVDIRQNNSQYQQEQLQHPLLEPEVPFADHTEEEEDLFLMSAAHDEDLRIPPPNMRMEQTTQFLETLPTGTASDEPIERVGDTESPAIDASQVTSDSTVPGIPGSDSPSGNSDSKAKPKYDIAKMLNVIRQSSSQSSPASQAAPAPSAHSEFWQNIFSGIGVTSSPTSSSSSAQRSPSQVKDPRLKKEVKVEEPSIEDSHKQESGLDQTTKGGENTEFRLVTVSVSGIDYSQYCPLYYNDPKMRNDPRLQNFFTTHSSPDQRIKSLPHDSCSKSSTSSIITQSTLASLMSSGCQSNDTLMSPTKKFSGDRDDRLTPTSPPHLTSLNVLPPLTLNEAPKKSSLLSIFPPPPPAMSPLELISSRSFTSRPPPLLHPHPNSNDSSPNQMANSVAPVSQMHDQMAGNGKGVAIDLSSKSQEERAKVEEEEETSVTSPDDTPASPASRRSSCDAQLSPPVIQATPITENYSRGEEVVEKSEQENLKNLFGSIDPTASPFC